MRTLLLIPQRLKWNDWLHNDMPEFYYFITTFDGENIRASKGIHEHLP